ncbi:nucleotidyl transferase AbiEii/AbiGii toxin family protein [Pigmentiphaga litoralis]|uniref:nucleotidyl transferase AbiEii/AbiGii toxin family protein n=1 Tax=Pigmentiphaga litoralis TaxID=516702 RepID=UPI003B4346C1
MVPVLSVAETQSEKVLSFLRRYAQHRAGHMVQGWDSTLVRHIYDVHCIFTHDAKLVDASALVFAALIQGDVLEFGRQHPEFASDPVAVLTRALDQVGKDMQTRAEYERNLLPLVYGKVKPSFGEAFASFDTVARTLLKAAR